MGCLDLICRGRRRRRAYVLPRREDGAADYTRPGSGKPDSSQKAWPKDNYWFILPHSYWRHRLDQELGLTGKAMLLIALQATSKKPSFYLPYEKARPWYGISAEACQDGFAELRSVGLLDWHAQKIKAPASPQGITTRWHYGLTGDFSTANREKLQEQTRREVKAKTRRA